MSREVSGTFLDYVARPGDALRIAPGGEMDTRDRVRGIVAHRPVARAQPQRVLGAVNGLLVRPLKGERISEQGVSQRKIRVQLQCPTKCMQGLAEATQSHLQHALCEVCPGVAVVEGECGLC